MRMSFQNGAVTLSRMTTWNEWEVLIEQGAGDTDFFSEWWYGEWVVTDERPDFDLVVYPGVMIRPYSVKRSFVGVTHFVFQFSVDWKVSWIVISPRRALPPAGECIITDVPTARPRRLESWNQECTRHAP